MLFETYSGRMVDLLDLRVEDLVLEDMLVPLSRIGRYGNHSEFLYSVGHHTLICAELARLNGESDEVIRYVLGHDLSESYLGDIPRPLKRHLSMYGEIEENVQNVIWEFLGLAVPDQEMTDKILKYDNGVLYWESYLVKRNVGEWGSNFKDEELMKFGGIVEEMMVPTETSSLLVYESMDNLFKEYFSGLYVG